MQIWWIVKHMAWPKMGMCGARCGTFYGRDGRARWRGEGSGMVELINLLSSHLNHSLYDLVR